LGHRSAEPPQLVLVVPGRYEQFWQWAQATRGGKITSTNRGAGSFTTNEGKRYQCATSFERTRGYDRGTPVIKVGTWWDHDWIYQLRHYFTNITEEDY
jgi:hypothetical protein